MNRFFVVLFCVVPSACGGGSPDIASPRPAPAVSNIIDGVTWEAGDWQPHLAAGDAGLSWGNHRAVVQLAEAATGQTVAITIPWRRADLDPASKAVVVVDATTGTALRNSWARRMDRESGDVVFQSTAGSQAYHVYYLPWESSGGYYPRVSYPKTITEADPLWLAGVRDREMDAFQQGVVSRIESVNSFHSFFPMEVVAKEEEVSAYMAQERWALFPEHRDRPIRMRAHLPQHWVSGAPGLGSVFSATALQGEYFTFQIGVFARSLSLEDVQVSFEGLPAEWQETITCYNCEGIDLNGQPFQKVVDIDQGTVSPLWIGLFIPENTRADTYSWTVTVAPAQGESKRARVSLRVEDAQVINRGFDNPETMGRLAWLNSTAGTDPDFIIEPYEPVGVEGSSLSILGREVDLGPTGLPDQVWSYFTSDLTGLAERPEPILAEPIEFRVLVDGGPVSWEPGGTDIRRESRGRAVWTSQSAGHGFQLRVEGALEYDGMLDYRIQLTATKEVAVDDIALDLSLVPDAATYMLGLGHKGGRRPDRVDWKWKVENHQEGAWLGGIHKGLQYVLRDENYERPLNTNFYQNQPLNLPPSWYNGGLGGIEIGTQSTSVTATNYSGPRSLQAGETLHFNVRFLITPFKAVDTGAHFRTRFVHKYVPVDSVRAWGGTVVNIHHANEINPYINYPFFNLDLQTAYIQEAHEKGIKVKLYDTIRELSYRAHELFALRSLGDEILNGGEGGGHSWMQEHMRTDYHSAWHAWRVDDAAMLNKGTSRWTNYYIEGLSWLAQNQHIDGLYLDDIAFSRATVKRMISVLDEHRDEVVIDLHSANQFNPNDGYISSAMLYMEHLPFITRLWFGEYFEYDRESDYWMTEVSGLPFGLMGEMLQDGGHPYRGLLYGMTARMYGDVDPRPVWKMMDDFGIEDSQMRGYWLQEPPVETGNPAIIATSFQQPGSVLIVLASWSDSDEEVSLAVDLEAMGLPAGALFRAPAVQGLQEWRTINPVRVLVPANKGLFVLVESP